MILVSADGCGDGGLTFISYGLENQLGVEAFGSFSWCDGKRLEYAATTQKLKFEN